MKNAAQIYNERHLAILKVFKVITDRKQIIAC